MKQLPVRFVPNVDTVVWDSSMQYDSGTIVRDTSEDEYTLYVSKKLVPRGTSLEDSDFWLVVGNVGAGGGDTSELESSVSTLESAVSELSGRPKVYYGTCSTAAGTSTKEVTTANGDFVKEDGAMLSVYFLYANSQGSYTTGLNVDGTGYASVFMGNTAEYAAYMWKANSVVCFVYYDNKFIIANKQLASSSQCGDVFLSDSTSSSLTASSGRAASPHAVKQAYDLANSAYELAESANSTVMSALENEAIAYTIEYITPDGKYSGVFSLFLNKNTGQVWGHVVVPFNYSPTSGVSYPIANLDPDLTPEKMSVNYGVVGTDNEYTSLEAGNQAFTNNVGWIAFTPGEAICIGFYPTSSSTTLSGLNYLTVDVHYTANLDSSD